MAEFRNIVYVYIVYHILYIIYKLVKREQKSSLILGNSFLERWKEIEPLCNLSFSLAVGTEANAAKANELHALHQAALFFELSCTKYSNLGHLHNNSFAPKKKNLHDNILKNMIKDNIWYLHELFLRLEEELGSPHVVSLVTDYNVMPVREKCLVWTHQGGLNFKALWV